MHVLHCQLEFLRKIMDVYILLLLRFSTFRHKRNNRYVAGVSFQCWMNPIAFLFQFHPSLFLWVKLTKKIVYVMDLLWTGFKPSPKSLMTHSLTHLCITRPNEFSEYSGTDTVSNYLFVRHYDDTYLEFSLQNICAISYFLDPAFVLCTITLNYIRLLYWLAL